MNSRSWRRSSSGGASTRSRLHPARPCIPCHRLQVTRSRGRGGMHDPSAARPARSARACRPYGPRALFLEERLSLRGTCFLFLEERSRQCGMIPQVPGACEANVACSFFFSQATACSLRMQLLAGNANSSRNDYARVACRISLARPVWHADCRRSCVFRASAAPCG